MEQIFELVTDLSDMSKDPWMVANSYFLNIGFQGLVCGAADRNTSSILGMFVKAPDSLLERYENERYAEIDPWAQRALLNKDEFIYSFSSRDQVFPNRPARVEALLVDLEAENFRSSIMTTSHNHCSFVIGLNLWSKLIAHDFAQYIAEHHKTLSVAAFVVLARMSDAVSAAIQHNSDAQWLDYDVLANPLSRREQEVLTWLASGAKNDVIAFKMGISITTVNFHLISIRL